QEEIRSLRKSREQMLGDLARLEATRLLAETADSNGKKIVARVFADHDLNYIKLLAQKLTRQSPNAIALLGSTAPPPALVFAASPGQPADMNALMKEALAKLGGRGGGSKDMAQGGPQAADQIEPTLNELAQRLSRAMPD